LSYNQGCWDAQVYDKVSRAVQYEWGKRVLNWRKWDGNETVMDAGCGSGLLTNLLAKRVPKGKVYAVDTDSRMLKQAETNLKGMVNVELMLFDLAQVRISEKLDVIFSNAALHWVKDHELAFRHFWDLLKPRYERAQLLIQCGGDGNLQRTLVILEDVIKLSEFKQYFAKQDKPWYFAKPQNTAELLKRIGYVNLKVQLQDNTIDLMNRKMYSEFVKTVILKSFLQYLSDENIKSRFLNIFLDRVEETSVKHKIQAPWRLDYVRLNIIANKP
jgi:trans-aconitate methyltransferase